MLWAQAHGTRSRRETMTKADAKQENKRCAEKIQRV
jgi:hypothetical protein